MLPRTMLHCLPYSDGAFDLIEGGICGQHFALLKHLNLATVSHLPDYLSNCGHDLTPLFCSFGLELLIGQCTSNFRWAEGLWWLPSFQEAL